MYLCVRDIDFASFYAFDIWFLNCSESVVFLNCSDSVVFFNCSDSVVFFNCSDSVVFFNCSESVVFFNCSESVVFFNCSDSVGFFNCSESVVFLNCSESVVFLNCSESMVFFFSLYCYLQSNLVCKVLFNSCATFMYCLCLFIIFWCFVCILLEQLIICMNRDDRNIHNTGRMWNKDPCFNFLCTFLSLLTRRTHYIQYLRFCLY
jgi:hypothetical protein